MNSVSDIYTNAELSLAAYSNLTTGISGAVYTDALQNDGSGLSEKQANIFASEWYVVTQYSDSTGLSVTVFQNNISEQKYLAIRGTDISDLGDLISDYYILYGLPSILNPQYTSLKNKVQEWIDSGILGTNFTVTGHSLGGYLAAGLVADFSNHVTRKKGTDLFFENKPVSFDCSESRLTNQMKGELNHAKEGENRGAGDTTSYHSARA